MAKTLIPVSNKTKTWLLLFAWAFLIVFVGKFVIDDALPYYGFDKEVYGRFWIMKWPLIGHISGGLIALTIGPFQFWSGFRNRYRKIHRVMGLTYITAILIGTISSVNLALTTGMAVHWTLGTVLDRIGFCVDFHHRLGF